MYCMFAFGGRGVDLVCLVYFGLVWFSLRFKIVPASRIFNPVQYVVLKICRAVL
jgi:hypothetical protein